MIRQVERYKKKNKNTMESGDLTFKVLPSLKCDKTSDDVRVTDPGYHPRVIYK